MAEEQDRKMTVSEIVTKLLGEIDPVGETQTDERRFENLKATILLVEQLLEDINYVATSNENRHEYSMKRASDLAKKFQKSNFEEYNDV